MNRRFNCFSFVGFSKLPAQIIILLHCDQYSAFFLFPISRGANLRYYSDLDNKFQSKSSLAMDLSLSPFFGLIVGATCSLGEFPV